MQYTAYEAGPDRELKRLDMVIYDTEELLGSNQIWEYVVRDYVESHWDYFRNDKEEFFTWINNLLVMLGEKLKEGKIQIGTLEVFLNSVQYLRFARIKASQSLLDAVSDNFDTLNEIVDLYQEHGPEILKDMYVETVEEGYGDHALLPPLLEKEMWEFLN